MKRTLLCLCTLFTTMFSTLSAQRTSLGIHATVNEYIGDLSGNNYSLYKFKNFNPGGALTLQQQLNKSFNLVEWAGYNKVEYFRPNADVVLGEINGVSTDFINLNVLLKYKFNNGYLFKEDAALAPFLIGGFGATYLNSQLFAGPQRTGKIDPEGVVKPSLIGGAGIYFRFNDVVGVEAASMFNRPFDDEWDGIKKGGNDIYLQHSLGLIFNLKKPADDDKDGVANKRDKCPNTPAGVTVDTKGCPVDFDNDGVADYLDKCPKLSGSVALNGCPDTDNDGVADIDDKCPTAAGLAKFEGCPDTDGDGVQDSKDKCPNTAAGVPVDENGCALDTDGDLVPDFMDKCPNTPKGIAVDAKGCPADADSDGVPDYLDKCPNSEKGSAVNDKGCPMDSDGDGVPDKADKCPNTAGPASNDGCPEIKEEVKKRLNFATRGIFFETGKANIKAESFPKLDEIVSIINEYPDYNLRIGGHTDNVGTDASNLTLSQARMDAVKSYLVSKNVSDSRLEAQGFGESKPLASNKTAVGRAKNRRVEMELFLK